MIICCDCMEEMSKMPDESVDMVFADPPFNIGKKYETYSDRRGNYREWCATWIGECFRLLKPTGSFYLMTITRHLEWKMPIMAEHGVFINLIAWKHVSACHSKRRFWLGHQPIMLYGKSEDYIFNTYAQTIESGQRRWGGYSTEYKGQLKDTWDDIPRVYSGSISHKEAILSSGTNKKAHPCQMPVDLPLRAILFSTNEDALILDPFVGSGTTVIAAIKTNRRYLGFEVDPKYVQLAKERIQLYQNGCILKEMPRSKQQLNFLEDE